MADFDNALARGTRLADYEIIDVLGEPGSFGITYRARDLHLHREVAIKEYFPNDYSYRRPDGGVAPRDEQRRGTFEWGLERFSEEARTLAQFDHRNIVKVLRLVADTNGTAYIVMELVKGRTLEAIVEAQGPMNAAQLTPILERLLDGCAAIHRIGILHRDIKPTNIIVTDEGEPVLIDFGAARDLALQKKAGFTAIVTDTYSPPEQYSREQPQGPWTDIYALAATAYFCLSGGAPTPATARAVGDGNTPATVAAAGRADPKLLKGLDWGLTLAAKDRPQTVEAWRAALDLSPGPLLAAKASLDRRAVLALAGGATLLGGLGAVMALTSGGGGPGKAIDDSSRPFKVRWTQDLGPVEGDPWPAICDCPGGAMVASRRTGADGLSRMLAAKVDDNGRTQEWLAEDPGSAAQTILRLNDGGAMIGGDANGQSRIVRLGPDWTPRWSRSYGEGAVCALLARRGSIVAAIGTGVETGTAKLISLNDQGDQIAEISLLDKRDDSVERVAALSDGGLIVVGRQITRTDEINTSQMWYARLNADYRELWRQQELGLGSARGWAVAASGDDIFIAGTTDDGGANARPHLLTLRVSAADGRRIWTKIEDRVDNGSGRALVMVPNGRRPVAYLAGTAGAPVSHARFAQLANDGRLLWDLQPPTRPGAHNEGALALAFRGPGDGYAAGFTYDGAAARLTVSRLES